MLNQNGKKDSSKDTGNLSFYWQYYGLTQDPFPVMSNPSDYFPLSQWEHHLDLIQHLVKNENVLLALIGGEGTGKTTFATQVGSSFSDGYFIHSFEADSLFSTRKLVRELETGFALKPRTNEAPEEQLDAQIAEVQHKQQPCLLIIDNAHFLPLETLNSLMFLLRQQSKNQMRLHIILFGDKNLQAKLNNLARHDLSGEMIHSIEIMPFSLEETKQYLIHRLNRAGLSGPMPLSQMNIEKIHAKSDGVPDRINRVAQQILLDNLSKQKSLSEPTGIKKHQTKIMGGCLLVMALVVATYVLEKQGEDSKPESQTTQTVISFAKVQQNMQAVATGFNSTHAKNQPQIITDLARKPEVTQRHAQATLPALNSKAEGKIVKAEKVVAHKLQNLQPSQLPSVATEVKMLAKEQPAKPIRLAKLETISAIPAQQPYHVDIIKHPMLAKTYNEKVVGNAKPRIENRTRTPARKNTYTTQEASVAKIFRAKGLKLTKGEDALLKQNSKDYTLQLIGLSYERSMLKFIQENHLHGDVHYVATKLHGKPWFVLVYGLYKTRLEASKAIKNLPASLKKYQPWPRQLKYVKLDIDKG